MPIYSYIDTGGKDQTMIAVDANTALKTAPNLGRHSGVQLMPGNATPAPTNTGNASTGMPSGWTVGANGAWNPVVSSTTTRQDNNATKADITGLQSAYNQSNALYLAEQQRLGALRAEAIDTINKTYEGDKIAQENSQTKDFASRATSLITSGGGYLGATQSQQGVLQNLQATFQTEKMALMTKRDAAINAANQAYAEKDFAIAKEMANNAKELQKEIYQREKDYSDQTIKIAAENRNQAEFELGIEKYKLGIAKDQVEAYAKMSDEQFNAIDKSKFAKYDSYYYPGYTSDMRDLTKKATSLKTQEDQLDMDYKIHTARLATDIGKSFKLGGVTYTGMKTKDTSGGGGTQEDRNKADKERVQGWFTSKTLIPGTQTKDNPQGITFLDTDGYATPEGWQTAYENSGLDRRKFIIEYGYLLKSSGGDDKNNPKYDNYGLTPAEMKVVNTVAPTNY